MKCIVLAGGRGERLWPLSRINFPKQFINIQKNHSIFQETIARNIAYCDEFIIVTNYDYRSIIANQMEAFQGVPYRCVLEEMPRKTTAAIILSCLDLQPSENVFVVSADLLIDTGTCNGLGYKDAILKAKEAAADGRITLFGKQSNEIVERFGYFTSKRFCEKPNREVAQQLSGQGYLQNLGMMLFQNGVFLNEFNRIEPTIFDQCRTAFDRREELSDGTVYRQGVLEDIPPVSIEVSLLEKTNMIHGIEVGFEWTDVGSLEDLSKTEFRAEGLTVQYETTNTVILNQSPRQIVVANGLKNTLIVNTEDALYVGQMGESHLLKQILHESSEIAEFAAHGTVFYHPWGYYEQLLAEKRYRIRKVVLLPGQTIYEHRHDEYQESWTIIQGTALITLNGQSRKYRQSDCISIRPGTAHQISNIGEQNVIFISNAVGDVLNASEFLPDRARRVTESDLGLEIEPMIKLTPAFKDYLWGGTKLRDIYGKRCDFDIIAESWELSTHPAGNSIVASGRHKGSTFGKYLESVGKQVLGWKCSALQSFPLLIKFIDAKQNLSVQVHPKDDYALENENEYGKSEMWYVIDSEPGAGLYVGFREDVSREEVERRITDNSILDILNFCPSKPGDVYFIPAGTVHAIGAGNLICEIQQNSNCTYRLYDYDRRDKYGNPRELHLRKALDVMDYKKYQAAELQRTDGIIQCKYFEVHIVDVDGEKRIQITDDSFYAVTCIKGGGNLTLCDTRASIHPGDSVFVPAMDQVLYIRGKLSLIISRV